jgi:hypothetical protein
MKEESKMTHEYIGTKQVTAWPQQKDGAEGYAVKYADGYISWSPKDIFEAAYIDIGHVSNMPPHHQRVIGEKAVLDDKKIKLDAFMQGEQFHVVCDEGERNRLINQYNAMCCYSSVLAERIAAF